MVGLEFGLELECSVRIVPLRKSSVCLGIVRYQVRTSQGLIVVWGSGALIRRILITHEASAASMGVARIYGMRSIFE